MKVPAATTHTPASSTAAPAATTETSQKAAPDTGEIVKAVAEGVKEVATDVANDAFEKAADASKGIEAPVGNTGATFETDAPLMKLNPATGKLYAVKAKAEHDAALTSADKKTTAQLHTEAEAEVSPDGIDDLKASSTLEVNHEGETVKANARVKADTAGQLQAKVHADLASKDGRSSASLDAEADKSGGSAHVQAEHRGENVAADLDATFRSDGTFDARAHAEATNKDGTLDGAVDVVADETGVAVDARGAIDGENIDVAFRAAGDTRDSSLLAQVEVEGENWAAAGELARDESGTRGSLDVNVDTPNVDAAARLAFDESSVTGEGAFAYTSDDGKTGVRGEVEGRRSRDGSFEDTLKAEGAAFTHLGGVSAEAGIAGGTNMPLTGTASIGVENKRGTLGVAATAAVNENEQRVGLELRLGR